MDADCGLNSSKMVESGEWTNCGTRGIIELSDVVVVGTSQRE